MGKHSTTEKMSKSASKSRWQASAFNIFKNNSKRARTPRRKKITKEVQLQKKQWELKVTPDNWFLGKVNVKSSDLVAETLKNRLTEHQKMLFRSTCFGKYLDIHEIAVNPQLIHQVLLRELNQPNDDELWFKLGNYRLKFGIEEFYLITSLQCKGDVNRVKCDTKYCRLNNEYFSHLTHITNDDIFNIFQTMPNHNNRDVVLMGILFLVTQLMYNTAYDRYVDETLLMLVDSPDMNAYPWGQDIFRLTLSSLKQALRNKRITIEGEGRPAMSYRLNGFVIAFQVWIYEILPILEMKLCSKVALKRPRILNWSSEVDDDIPNINLANDIFGNEHFRVVPMIPQAAEALDRNYVALKRTSTQSNRSNTVSARSIVINDDDDFVIPPQPRLKNRQPIAVPQAKLSNTKRDYYSDKYNFEDDPIVQDDGLRDGDDICDHEIDMHRSKGKNVVYDVDDSDDDCQLISPICNPKGIHTFPGGSSSSPFVDKTHSVENHSVKQCDNNHSIGVQNPRSKDRIHQSYPSNSIQVNMECIGKKPATYQAANMNQDNRITFDKYTSRLDIIVGGHADIAVELFILKKKMEELVQFVNEGITEAIECLHTRCLSTNRPKYGKNQQRPPPQGRNSKAGQQGSHAASYQDLGKGLHQPVKSTGKPVIPLQDSTNTYLRRSPNLSRNSPVSCMNTRGSIQPPSKCGSNSILLQSSIMAQKSPNLHQISKDSSIIGKRVEYSPQAPTPSDKGSIAKPATVKPRSDSTNSINMCPLDDDAPSFDLGIFSDIHDGGIVLDDGLFLSNQYLAKMDNLAAVRLSRSREIHKQPQDMNLKVKGSTHNTLQENQSAPASKNTSYPCTNDDGNAKIVSQSTPAKKMRPKHFINPELSPIPINFQEEASQVEPNLLHHTPVPRSVQVENVSPTTGNFFVYKTCLESPSEFDITSFKSFCHAAGDSGKATNGYSDAVIVMSTPMTLGPIIIYTMAWWHDLHEVGKPLNDSHIDVVFYFMRMFLKLRVDHKIRATTTDCNFDVKIRGISSEIASNTSALHKHNSLFSYANGRKFPFNVQWSQVDHVLIPTWIETPGHWILGHFDMVNWRLDVYNSLTSVIKNATVYTAIRSMALALPALASSLNCSAKKFPVTPLECRLIDDCPQQRNGGDCGIYIIKYAEYIIEGRIKEMPALFDTASARTHIAAQLYKYVREEPDIIWFNGPRSLRLSK